MSAINVNSITGRTGSHGPVLTGLTTVTGDLHVGGGVSFSGITTVSTSFHVVGTGSSVGVGTDDPRSKLDIQGSDEELRFYRDGGDRFGGLRYTGALFKLRLPTNDPFIVDDASNNERFRVNANGQVKIGGNTLVTPDTDADNLVIDTGDVDSGISILSATTGRIYFGDAGDHEAGSIRYVHTDNSMRFETANTERIRVGAGGSVGIATNDPKTQVDINCFNPSNDAYRGTVKINQYGHILQQNNTVVSNSGVSSYWSLAPRDSGDFDISFDEVDNSFNASGFDVMTLSDNGNVSIPNGNLIMASGQGIDFSATANSGGTMSSELLDDYEEGTWTPTVTGLGDHTNTAGSTWGKYTKIGNRVFITFRYSWTSRSTTNGGVVFLGSLPFSATNDSRSDAVYIGGLEGIISNSGREHYGGQVVHNSTTIQFRASGHDVSENSLFGSLSTSMNSGYFYGGANYIV